jgi:beta-aspartyl-peptidase (threonine type)
MPIRPFATPLAVVALLTSAAPPPAAGQAFPAPAPADSAAIIGGLVASQDGWNEANLAKHVSLYVDSVTFMTGQGPRPGRDRVVESFTRTYFRDGRPIQALAFDHVALRALGPDHVLMTGNFHLTGGDRPDQAGWFTLIWARTADGWRVIHDHSS